MPRGAPEPLLVHDELAVAFRFLQERENRVHVGCVTGIRIDEEVEVSEYLWPNQRLLSAVPPVR